MNRICAILAIALSIEILGVGRSPAAEVWTGPRITFSKSANADPTLPVNQDRITDNVWLTRASSSGLFNVKTETNYVVNSSPADTEWSFGATADIGSLTFVDWRTAVGGNPPASVGEDMVLHLITDDVYIDIKFLTWGERPFSGGNFSYERSTPVPEPATVGLVLVALTLMFPTRPRCRR